MQLRSSHCSCHWSVYWSRHLQLITWPGHLAKGRFTSCNLKVWGSKPQDIFLFVYSFSEKGRKKDKREDAFALLPFTYLSTEVAINKVSKFRLHSLSGLNVNPQGCTDRRDFGGFGLVCRCTLWDPSVSRLN